LNANWYNICAKLENIFYDTKDFDLLLRNMLILSCFLLNNQTKSNLRILMNLQL
jgi:hypothetical protein